jgi:NAD kinase
MYDKIVVITKKTPLEELIERFNTVSQAKFYIEHSGQSFAEYEAYHGSYQAALKRLRQALPSGIKSQFIERGFLTNFLFGEKDLVVTLGPDGLVVNTAKYLDGQPIMAVNPDRERIDGVLLPFWIEYIEDRLASVIEGRAAHEIISMAEARLDNGQSLLALNDFFVGPKSHTCLRYAIEHKGVSEEQLSSGIIISTGAGSTGWIRAVMAGAQGVYLGFKKETERKFEELERNHDAAKAARNSVAAAPARPPEMPAASRPDFYPEELRNAPPANLSHLIRFERTREELVFMVREPFESKTSKAGIIFGRITPNTPLKIVSHTPSGGVIFSDGIENDYLEFNSGRTAVITIARKKVTLLQPGE